jgi:hypothetical protein
MSDVPVPVANCKKGDRCGILIEDPLEGSAGRKFRAPYKVLAVSKDGARYKVVGDFMFALGNRPFWAGNLNCAKLDSIPDELVQYFA